MRRNIVSFLASSALLLAPVPAAGAMGGTWDARVTRVKGKVTIFMAEGGGEHGIKAKRDMPLSKGDRIVVGGKGLAEVGFKGDSAVQLGPGSELVVGSVEKKSTRLKLTMGYLVAKLKLFSRRQFRVRTPTATAAVRGTEFAVEVLRPMEEEDSGRETTDHFKKGGVGDGSKPSPAKAKKAPPEASSPAERPRTVVAVFNEGKVAVSSAGDKSGKETILNPGEETECVFGVSPTLPGPLDILKNKERTVKDFRKRVRKLRKQFRKYNIANRRKLRNRMNKRLKKIRKRNEDMRREMRDEIRKGRKKGLDIDGKLDGREEKGSLFDEME